MSLSISSAVQSAVSPVLRFAATLGMKERPIGVAPARTMAGLCSLIRLTSSLEYGSSLNFSNTGLPE